MVSLMAMISFSGARKRLSEVIDASWTETVDLECYSWLAAVLVRPASLRVWRNLDPTVWSRVDGAIPRLGGDLSSPVSLPFTPPTEVASATTASSARSRVTSSSTRPSEIAEMPPLT
jgi:hypothetical protein